MKRKLTAGEKAAIFAAAYKQELGKLGCCALSFDGKATEQRAMDRARVCIQELEGVS